MDHLENVQKTPSKRPRHSILELFSIQAWPSCSSILGATLSLKGDPCHRLRESIRQDLEYCGVKFEFLVQLQTDARAMPVEDPTVNWDELKSPYRRIAEIQIESQKLGPDSGPCPCENLSFSPWNSLPEHEPLGGINRVRKDVYKSVSDRRIRINQEP